jgi:PDZ domain-containing protein
LPLGRNYARFVKPLFTPVRLAILAFLVFGVAAYLFVAPSDDFIFLPDRARPLAPLVEVRGEQSATDGGGIYFVTVDVRRATRLEEIFPSLQEGSTLVDEELVQPPGISDRTRRRSELRDMQRSQQIAAAVAFRELGLPVSVERLGARVTQVLPNFPAAGKLRSGDVLVAVDGRRVRSRDDLRRLIGTHRPPERVRLRVRRDGKTSNLALRTVSSPDQPGRALIGVVVEQAADIELPKKVRIDLGNVGGPSAGLAFALDLLEELGRDIDNGHRVAATGELALDGTVHPVGGLKQKTIGARRSDVDVFVVPAGDNAAEARRHAGDLRIVAVRSFQQALRQLATLPAKS